MNKNKETRIPQGHAVVLTEYLCECDNEFYVSPQREVMYCPFCGEHKAWANKEVKVYVKKDIATLV